MELDWERYGFNSEQAKDWQQFGFAPSTAYYYRIKGISASDAAQWAQYGFSAEQAERWKAINLTPSQAAQWNAEGIDSVSAQEWIQYGYTSTTASTWSQIGLTPDAVLILKKAGFGDEKIKSWATFVTDCGDICNGVEADRAKAAIKWQETGVLPAEAKRYEQLNIDIPMARIIKVHCNNGLEDGSIVYENPYTVEHKCYFLQAATVVQLLSRRRAIVQDAQATIIGSILIPNESQPAPVILDFGHFDAPAEGSLFSAILLGEKPIVTYSFGTKEIRASASVLYLPN